MYKLLVWRDDSGICFKFGREYGFGCWENIFPKKRPFYIAIPIFKKPFKKPNN